MSIVRALALRSSDVSRDGPQSSVLLQGQPCRDQRAGELGNFRNQDPITETTDDTVANGEVRESGKGTTGELADNTTLLPDPLVQLSVLSRAHNVNPVSLYSNRCSPPTKASMSA